MQNVKGFTLIEILLNITISSVTILGVSAFLTLVLQAQVKNQSIAEVNQQGIEIMQLMTQTVRNAESILVPAEGTDGTSLALTLDDPSVSPTVFSLAGNVMQITQGAGAAVSLSNEYVEVSGFTVQNLAQPGTPGSVRIQFTLSRVNDSGRNEYTYTRTFTASASSRQP